MILFFTYARETDLISIGSSQSIIQENDWKFFQVQGLNTSSLFLSVTVAFDQPQNAALAARSGSVPTIWNGKIQADYVDYDGWYLGSSIHNLIIHPEKYNDSILYIGIYSPAGASSYTLSISQSAEHPCPNDCSGQGTCNFGKCYCKGNFIGKDCSFKSTRLFTNKSVFITLKSKQRKFVTFYHDEADVEIEFKSFDTNITIYTMPSHGLDTLLPSAYEYKNKISGFHAFYTVDSGSNWYFGLNNENSKSTNVIVTVKLKEYQVYDIMMIIYCLAGAVAVIITAIVACIIWNPRIFPGDYPEWSLDLKLINKNFPKKLYSETKSTFEISTCPICLVNFSPNDYVRELHCGHIYHDNCIDLWFKDNTYCCLCKKDCKHTEKIVISNTQSSSGSEELEVQVMVEPHNSENHSVEQGGI